MNKFPRRKVEEQQNIEGNQMTPLRENTITGLCRKGKFHLDQFYDSRVWSFELFKTCHLSTQVSVWKVAGYF